MNIPVSEAWQVHRFWSMRAALVMVITALADGVVGWFATNPFPWVVLIPGTLPLSMLVFVARPVLKQAQRGS